MRAVHTGSVDSDEAIASLKNASASLTAMDVPLAAIAFSGNALTLGMSGVHAGLSTLGMGFGSVTGVIAAMLIGTACFIAVDWATGRVQPARSETDLKSDLLIANLEHTIAFLASEREVRIEEGAPADEKVGLRTRLRSLQRLLVQARGARV